MPPIVVDTGPLVAYFAQRDHDHERVRRWFEAEARQHRLLSVEAVVTETTHLLADDLRVQTAFVEWAGEALQVEALPRSAYIEVAAWMRGYGNVPMDFADACVLWLYGTTPGAAILTLDERGFGVYRLPGRQRRRPAVVTLPPRRAKARHAR